MSSVNNFFIQAMPDGPDQNNIPMLLERVARSIAELGEVRVNDIILKNTRISNEKPELSVYYNASSIDSESKYKPKSLSVELEKGEHQDDFLLLLNEVYEQLGKIRPTEVYDMVIDNDINELGNRYKATVYYDA